MMRRYRRSRPQYRFERAITFDPTVGSPSNFYRSFADAVFLGVDVESLLGDAEVSSLETGVPVRKGHNFWSNRWISLKILQEFPDAVFLGVDVESLLDDVEVSSLETRVRVRKGHNFYPTVGSPSNFTGVFGRRFPRSRCVIATRWCGGIVARD
jgi:hypothetical protein